MDLHKRIIILLLTAFCLPGIARSQSSTPSAPDPRTGLPPRPAPGTSLLPDQSAARPPRPYWQQQVNYLIDVNLNQQEHALEGFLKMEYHNNSPDTLHFIWIHCWPNAYKNDLTAFSDQLLDNGRTDFYFSDKGKRGYINHLDFRIEGVVAKMEDHPRYIDIIKIVLPQPLLPGTAVTITTPFHVQLPFPFSGSGYNKGLYQVTQWIPQPAVYDQKGWHEMPYLDQGGAYNEFGNYDVRITLPKNYVVAATGAASPISNAPPETQTLRYQQNNISGFAWFANPHFHTDHDTLQLPSGRIIDLYAYYTAGTSPIWQNSIAYIKRAIRFRSSLIGEYPYDIISVAEITAALAPKPAAPGMAASTSPGSASPVPPSSASASYPTLAGIATPGTDRDLDLAIQHAIGYNWFHAVLGADQRTHPWMTEGFTTYYDRRYAAIKYPPLPSSRSLPPVPGPQQPVPRPRQPANKTKQPSPRSQHPANRSTIASTTRPKTTRSTAPKPTAPTANPASRNTPPHDMPNWVRNKLPADPALLGLNTQTAQQLDQPITTAADDFTLINYNSIAHTKTALWLHQLEDSLGTSLFDSCMQTYFKNWSFRHPTPEDFQTDFTNSSSRPLTGTFARLNEKGPLSPVSSPRKIKPAFLFSERNTDKFNYINLAPAVGYNTYDHFMVGALIHNFNRPPTAFQFALAPLYATNSHRFNGAGYLQYSWFPGTRRQPTSAGSPGGPIQKITAGLELEKFSSLSGTDSNSHSLFGGFYKIAPSLRLNGRNNDARSTIQRWIEWKTFLIGEQTFAGYVQKSTDSLTYPSGLGKYQFRYLNQLSFNIEDNRVLYPYRALLQFQQGDRFYRINFTGNYFFNYAEGGGLDLRFFAAKFGHLQGQASSLELFNYQPKLTGVNGSEDYTYSNYFVGRNDFTGFASQQIMNRDGGLKIRVANFPWLEGRSDNWVSALNLNSTLPTSIVPPWLRLKVFLDIGTYAEAWQQNAQTSRFLYTAGLQLSLFHNIVTLYAPLIYSSDFRDQLKTLPDQNTFWKKLSFNIELQNLFHRNSPGSNTRAGGSFPGHISPSSNYPSY